MRNLRPVEIGSGPHRPDAIYLAELERQIGAPLPMDFRSFLATYGGCGFLEYVVFPLPAGCRWAEAGVGILSVVFGAFVDGVYDLQRNFTLFHGRIPEGLVPFAEDPGGNLLCLSVLPDGSEGGVFFWDHGADDLLAGLHVVSETMLDFVNALRVTPNPYP